MASKGAGTRAVAGQFAIWLTLVALLAGAQTGAPGSQNSSNPTSAQASSDQSQGQPASDLSAAAENARKAREAERSRRSANSEAVDAMAAELSEASEQGQAAPVGYRYYKFAPGDYSILVPADAEVEGRDSYGLKLLSSEAMGTRTVVILGDPIPARGSAPLEILHNAAAEYFPGCRTLLSGLGKPLNGHAAGTQGLSMCPLHNEILGFAEFVQNGDFVVPVVCGYPFMAEDFKPGNTQPIKTVVNKYNRESNGYRACDTILPSLHFTEQGSQWQPKTAVVAPKKAVITNALLGADSTPAPQTAQETSLGDFARTHKKVVAADVVTEIAHASPGFAPYSFRYCTKDQCFDATLEMPVKATKNERFNVAYIGLFEFEVPVGDSKAVIQATMGAPTRPGIITRKEFIHTKIDWWMEYGPAIYFTGAGKAEVYREELTAISNMPARLATYRTPTAFQPVVTQLAAYMAPGVFVQIRCSVPEKGYSDAQAMCEHVVHSLQVSQAKEIYARLGHVRCENPEISRVVL